MPKLRRFQRRDFAAFSLLGLCGCNFRPLHGGNEGLAVNQSLASTAVIAPRGRSGQLLYEELIRSLQVNGETATAEHELIFKIARKTEPLAIQLDDTETRFDLLIEVKYWLRDPSDNSILVQGAASQISSYNVVSEPFATLVSEQDSERRAMVGIASQIRNQLALYFSSNSS